MGLPFLKTNGLFANDADGRLLFFATPTAKFAYVVPDANREDPLRTLSKYWGLCELFSVTLVAPVALHFGGALGLLMVFAVFAIGSPIGYHFALKELLTGLESVIHEPLERNLHALSLLKTVAEETRAGLLWLCEIVSIVPLLGALPMLLNAHRAHQVIGALMAIVFFGSASIAGVYLISIKRRGIVATEMHSFAARSVALDG